MSDNENQSSEQTELEVLKIRATTLGITFSNNIGVETLRERIREKQAQLDAAPEEQSEDQPNPLASSAPAPLDPSKPISLRQHLINEKMKLVRLRIQNMDPKKANLQGEILVVANEFLGTVRKFVPFGEATDNGFHVPYCLYELLKSRKFLDIKTRTNKQTGQIQVIQQWVREFSLEILPPLTEKELAQLRYEQSASGRIG